MSWDKGQIEADKELRRNKIFKFIYLVMFNHCIWLVLLLILAIYPDNPYFNPEMPLYLSEKYSHIEYKLQLFISILMMVFFYIGYRRYKSKYAFYKWLSNGIYKKRWSDLRKKEN